MAHQTLSQPDSAPDLPAGQGRARAPFLLHRLATGLTVVGQPMRGVRSAAVGLMVPAGPHHEDPPIPAGVSHFLEALALQGTRHRDARALTEAFEEIGARRDSSVERDHSWYGATVLGRHLARVLELLVDVVRAPAFVADEMPKVRTRLLQSLAQQEDEPARKVFALLREAYFGTHPAGRPPVGTVASLTAITRDDLLAYWQARYTGCSTVLSVAGDFDFDAVCRQVEGLCGDWRPGEVRTPLPPPRVRSAVRSERKESSQQHLAIGLPGLPLGHPDIYAAAVLSLVFGGSMDSRLFREVREKRGLAYSVSASHVAMENAGMYRVYAGTTPEKAAHSLAVIVREARRLAADGITDGELTRAKTRLKSSVIMAAESTTLRRRAIGLDWWYEGRVRSLDELRESIDAVERPQVDALARSLDLGATVVIASVGPRDDLAARAEDALS